MRGKVYNQCVTGVFLALFSLSFYIYIYIFPIARKFNETFPKLKNLRRRQILRRFLKTERCRLVKNTRVESVVCFLKSIFMKTHIKIRKRVSLSLKCVKY